MTSKQYEKFRQYKYGNAPALTEGSTRGNVKLGNAAKWSISDKIIIYACLFGYFAVFTGVAVYMSL